MQCIKYRGAIAIVGEWVDKAGGQWRSFAPEEAQTARDERDGAGKYHVTVIPASECNIEVSGEVEKVVGELTAPKAVVVGTTLLSKGSKQSWYAVVYCPTADEIRAQVGLPPKEFHITLGFLGGDLYGLPSLYQTIKWQADVHVWLEVIDLITSTNHHVKRSLQPEVRLLRRFHHVCSLAKGLDVDMVKALREAAHWCLQRKTEETTALASDIGYLLLNQGLPIGLQILMNAEPTFTSAEEFGSFLPVTLSGMGSIETKLKVIRHCNVSLMDRVGGGARHKGKPYTRTKVFCVQGDALQVLSLQRNFSWVSLAADVELAKNPELQRQLPYLLAGSAIPTHASQLRAMTGVGIRHIITVHESPLPRELCPTVALGPESVQGQEATRPAVAGGEIVSYHFHVLDRTPPTSAQLRVMCELIHAAVTRGEGVLVHCQGGVGRTNTVIIAYLMWAQGLSAVEATAQVTAQRSIILSQIQKNALQRWWTECNERRAAQLITTPQAVPKQPASAVLKSDLPAPTEVATAAVPAPISVPPTLPGAAYRKVAAALNLPSLIVLCGFAASGKSTFSKALVQHTDYFVRINKDDMRAKNQCEDLLFDALSVINKGKSGGSRRGGAGKGVEGVSADAGAVVVDCCNLTKIKREEWLQLAHRPRAWCVFFDVPLAECKERIQHRTGHPTIQSGPAGVRILDTMARALEAPSAATAAKEGFERLLVIRSAEEANALLRAWKIPVPDIGQSATSAAQQNEAADGDGGEGDHGEHSPSANHSSGVGSDALLKFPRTSHILNLGAATRDDKVLGPAEIACLVGPQHHIIVEEKLDGANMGISISQADGQIVVQNRSHFISSKYHPQFAPLDHWLAQHTAELWTILAPGRHILYGEWLYATHSVKYTHLPGWFVAYDLYDRVTGTFASRSALASVLAGTTIPHVPLVYEGKVSTVEQLKSFVEGGSAFNHARREGVVVRVCEGDRLISRAKLVRSDFIAGNERWNRSTKLETNTLAPEAVGK